MACQLHLAGGEGLSVLVVPRDSSAGPRGVGMKVDSVSAPQEIKATGVRKGFLEDLALKILYLHGEMTLIELSNHLGIGLGVVDEVFQFFRKEQLCEVKGMVGGTHRITASAQGKTRAMDLLALNQYSGPAPVSLMEYTNWVRTQSVQTPKIGKADLKRAFNELVLNEDLLSQLGTAVISGASIFLYGPAGTGKTSIACRIPEIYNDEVWIPNAVVVDDQIITIYDPGVHRKSERSLPEEFDKRWILCHRPRVLAGGELSAEMLDLHYNPASRYFTAPLQMKANNGVLILDDFGRQRIRPEELLNRWMTPLDRRVDFLNLPGGRKFEIPFDVFVVFSTNQDPRGLSDEAFLRRIANKIKVDYPTPEQFVEIFRAECWSRFLHWDAGVIEQLVSYITEDIKQPLRGCYARDLVNQIFWAASYRGAQAQLTIETLKQACNNYFLNGPND